MVIVNIKLAMILKEVKAFGLLHSHMFYEEILG